MRHALVTIAAPIAEAKIDQALRLIEPLGNPAQSTLQSAMDRLDGDAGIHFASLHAIRPTDPQSSRGHLVLEFSADGEDDEAIARIVNRIGKELEPVFALAENWRAGDLAYFFRSNKVRIGPGWMDQAGLAFAGTPGMSVGRIRQEEKLAQYLAALIGGQEAGLTALDRLERIRQKIRGSDYAWALETPTSLPVQPQNTIVVLVLQLVISFIKTYLWPLAIPFLIVLGFGVFHAIEAGREIMAVPASLAFKAWLTVNALWSGLLWLLGAICAFVIPVLLAILALYASLRNKEKSNWLDESRARREVLKSILENENKLAHNHMISVTRLKPGFTRVVTIRIAFWLIGGLARLSFKPGHLGEIGTIHFARWVTLPGSKDFVFFSNYGGSWESYLEDFITKAHNGLTAVWSNTVGFPRSENLFQKGATDGERFKRYARRRMFPTPFWYSAYPDLTTANIRTYAAIRCGLAAAMTDEEAGAWLTLFGSATRPEVKLESNQIQSLVFGGLGFMPHGKLLLINLDELRPATRGWLKEIRTDIAFDDGRRLKRKAVLTLALGPGALIKAGLPADAVESFPAAYLDGMTGPGRARILGDETDIKARDWWWDPTYDVAVLVYGEDEDSVVALTEKVTAQTLAYGHKVGRTVPLMRIPAARADRKEPFGFVDGTSQPVIRGTYRGLRHADPIHLVEPGEFILGYPDNRGNIPPGPTLRAQDDPENTLPIRCDNTAAFGSNVVDAPRDIGRNGSFLVIRQLEQNTDTFKEYCESEATRLANRLGAPYVITPDFIGAKMLGRWPDGSSLLRNPYQSYGESDIKEQSPTSRPTTKPEDQAAIAPAPAPATKVEAVKPGETAPPVAGDTPKKHAEDNDFLFGTEDPQGLRCPFGAHIRRANPRDSLEPGSQVQIDISNRHRIMRIGRRYAPQGDEKHGLMFMCLNGDIERQFEFVQQTWLGSLTFHGLADERDPFAGNKDGCPRGFTIPTRDGPIRLKQMSQFVKPRGGGYFFLPGKRLLEFISE